MNKFKSSFLIAFIESLSSVNECNYKRGCSEYYSPAQLFGTLHSSMELRDPTSESTLQCKQIVGNVIKNMSACISQTI